MRSKFMLGQAFMMAIFATSCSEEPEKGSPPQKSTLYSNSDAPISAEERAELERLKNWKPASDETTQTESVKTEPAKKVHNEHSPSFALARKNGPEFTIEYTATNGEYRQVLIDADLLVPVLENGNQKLLFTMAFLAQFHPNPQSTLGMENMNTEQRAAIRNAHTDMTTDKIAIGWMAKHLFDSHNIPAAGKKERDAGDYNLFIDALNKSADYFSDDEYTPQ